MKKLSDLKRDINVGDSIILQEIQEADYTGIDTPRTPLKKIDINPKLSGIRLVTEKNTIGFYLKGINTPSTRGSFCDWPKASALEYYDGHIFTIIEKDIKGEIWQKRTYQILTNNN